MKTNILLIITFIALSLSASAQSVIEDFNENSESNQIPSELVTEKIVRVSNSKRTYIISNENESFSKGDFITLVLNSKLAARAIVAKSINNVAGIKIIKIYSLDLFKLFRTNLEVQVIRGDDSFFGAKKKEDEESEDTAVIKDEEDLYNETFLEDDLSMETKNKRSIKTDNIVSINYGLIEGLNNDGSSQRYTHLNGMWMYQFEDNIWAELGYGQNLINDYPSPGLDTKMTNLTLRIKYTVAAPFFSYVQPYLGFQIINATSPNAGVDDPTDDVTPSSAELDNEINMVENLKKKNIIFGVTVLKRLVPGWFIRADLGSDIINFGFSLEF
ncbi:hypothetical protein A9Q84_20480 [Halobacteriovorax marinus]|uniref:Uncharacterized protein n=1 Tax=Halobacteriovorax marinus TaxID=97084 RepID=A0A1Y5F6Z5_9BACT|nr:hypothetical protein A9Q84_20480 [Halobacteriovorax marinus]